MKLQLRNLALAGCLGLLSTPALADGNETLGAPTGLTIATGSDYLLFGAGLAETGSASAPAFVPLEANVVQVFAYWDGLALDPNLPGVTDQITLNGMEVTGALIGGPSAFIGPYNSFAYRADVTSLGLIAPGSNTVTASGLDFDYRNNGFGLVVLLDGSGDTETIALRDGSDFAYGDFAAPFDTTDLQTFHFAPSEKVRLGEFGMFVSGVDLDRPSVIEVTVGSNTLRLADLLGSGSGSQWDVRELSLDIPAGVTEVSIRVLSEDSGQGPYAGGQVASLNWLAATFSIENAEGPQQYGCTPHFWSCNWWRWDPWCTSDNVTSSLVLTDRFNAVLGVNPWQSGLWNHKKLWNGLNGWSWGGRKKRALNRHVVAALLNADSNINYPYTVAEVRALYRDAVGAASGPATVRSALQTLRQANRLGCPW